MSDEDREHLRHTLRELRDALGDAGLEKIYARLGVRGIGEISDVDAAIELAESMIAEAPKARGKGCVQATLNAMADDLYARRRGVSVDE